MGIKKQEQDRQARDDARVMAQYQEILSDRARMNRAIKEASRQVLDLNKRVNNMRNVINTKPSMSKSGFWSSDDQVLVMV